MGTKALTQENNFRKNLEVIETYLCADDEDRHYLTLTATQKKLMERWSFADEQLRKDKWSHESIVEDLMQRFGIGKSSAWDDLRNAQIVFGAANALNKRYVSYAQVRRIEKNIRLCQQAQDWKAVADLEKVLQKAIAELPDAQAPKSARQIIYNIQNNTTNNTFSATDSQVSDAVKLAESFLEYEEVEDLEEDEGAPE